MPKLERFKKENDKPTTKHILISAGIIFLLLAVFVVYKSFAIYTDKKTYDVIKSRIGGFDPPGTDQYLNSRILMNEANSRSVYAAKEYITSKGAGNVNGSSTDEGLYKGIDDYGYTYFFKGNTPDNYVKFANKYWRIVRINGDGSIRLIYAGTTKDATGDDLMIGASAYNNTMYWDLSSVGYTYGNGYDFHDFGRKIRIDNVYGLLSSNYNYADDYEYNSQTHTFNLKGNITSLNWNNDNSSILSTYKYTCFGAQTGCKYVVKMIQNDSGIAIAQISNYGSDITAEKAYSGTTDSTIKAYVDSWYESNLLSYQSFLSDTLFCNDKKIVEDNSEFVSTLVYQNYENFRLTSGFGFTCYYKDDRYTVDDEEIGNGFLKYPISLITADELLYAGCWGGNCYIQNNTGNMSMFWTLTPSTYRFDIIKARNVTRYRNSFDRDGNPFIDISLGVRPVINLKADTLYKGGNGEADTPYLVE